MEVAQDLENIFARFKYDADKVSGELETSLLKYTSGAQQ